MNWERTVSWLGMFAVLGGALRALMAPAAAIWGTDSMQELVPGLIACFLMAIGSLGLWFGQLPRIGMIGGAGFLLLSFGNMMTACLVWSTMTGAPGDGQAAELLQMVNNVASSVGLLISSIATIRSGLLPRWAAVLLLVWPFLSFLPYVADWVTLLWGLSYVGLGLPVWLGQRERASSFSVKG
ncbi:hypothetical protein ACFFK0_28990 [Paenibacillus chartarius]|uniref:Uncharacterized protein n=1 Tax=Paenibacillus chartarius TaxID=747481 RepID=A0ABV6DUX1_9BACL